MRQLMVFTIGCLMILGSCAPKISTSISKNYPPLDYREDVKVYGLKDEVPSNADEIGIVKIGDTGFSTNCGWKVVIDDAKLEARKVGGNAIKITDHILPSAMGSTCHRITATILKIDSLELLKTTDVVDSALINADYALIHVYRYGGYGVLIGYDLHLGDSVICRVKNNCKETIKIKKDGLNSLWARTEAKEEIPVNIKFGHEYYVRCGISMGMLVGRPRLELVDNSTGEKDIQSMDQPYDANKRDLIILNDGRKIICLVDGEDKENVYFTTDNNGRKEKTQISKEQIKSIEIINK